MDNNVKLFDALAHPTLNGLWLNNQLNDGVNSTENQGMTFNDLSAQLKNTDCSGAVACGLPKTGGYTHEKFFDACKKIESTKFLFQVAALEDIQNYKKDLSEIKGIGYKGVKIHCRLLNTSFNGEVLGNIFKECFKLGLIVFLCTYDYRNLSNGQVCSSTFKEVIDALKIENRLKLIFVHGGVHEMMFYYELVRHNKNFLLDLSYTLPKYHNSSIGYDIKFLMEHMDQRIVFGVDSPEYKFEDIFELINEYSNKLSKIKRTNFFNDNLANFLYP